MINESNKPCSEITQRKGFCKVYFELIAGLLKKKKKKFENSASLPRHKLSWLTFNKITLLNICYCKQSALEVDNKTEYLCGIFLTWIPHPLFGQHENSAGKLIKSPKSTFNLYLHLHCDYKLMSNDKNGTLSLTQPSN